MTSLYKDLLYGLEPFGFLVILYSCCMYLLIEISLFSFYQSLLWFFSFFFDNIYSLFFSFLLVREENMFYFQILRFIYLFIYYYYYCCCSTIPNLSRSLLSLIVCNKLYIGAQLNLNTISLPWQARPKDCKNWIWEEKLVEPSMCSLTLGRMAHAPHSSKHEKKETIIK